MFAEVFEMCWTSGTIIPAHMVTLFANDESFSQIQLGKVATDLPAALHLIKLSFTLH